MQHQSYHLPIPDKATFVRLSAVQEPYHSERITPAKGLAQQFVRLETQP